MAYTYIEGNRLYSSKHGFYFFGFLNYEIVTNNDTTYTLRLQGGAGTTSSGSVGWTNVTVTLDTTGQTSQSTTGKYSQSGANQKQRYVPAPDPTNPSSPDNIEYTWTKTTNSQVITVTVTMKNSLGTSTATVNLTIPARSFHTITYNLNGGDGTTPATQTKYNNVPITLASTSNITRTGYTVLGWSTNPSATTRQYASGASYTVNSTTNIILYAVWLPNPYQVVAHPGGGTITPENGWVATTQHNITMYSKWVDFNSEYGTLPTISYNDGHHQLRRWTNEDATQIITSSTKLTTPEVQHIYAQWLQTHTITYDLNGGSGNTPATQTKVEGTNITLASTSGITRTGYTILGWDTNPSATIAQYASGASYAVNSTVNIKLCATWKPNTYTLTINPQGGTLSGSTSNSTRTMTYDSTDYNSIGTPTKTGYTFGGWYTSTNGAGTQVFNANGQYTSNTTYWNSGKWHYANNLTVYAKWTLIEYDITYTLGGGSVAKDNPVKYTVETNTFTLNNPTKANCSFSGWTGSNGSTAQTSITISKGSTTGDKTYTANWIGNKIAPKFVQSVNAIRCQQNGTDDAEEGTYCKVVFKANCGRQYKSDGTTIDNKSTTITIKWKENNASSYKQAVLLSNSSDTTFTTTNYSFTGILRPTSDTVFNANQIYDIQVVLTSNGLTATGNNVLSATYFPLDFNATGTAAGFFRSAPDNQEGLFISKQINYTDNTVATPTATSKWIFVDDNNFLRKGNVNVGEANLSWGGGNYAGSFGPIDAGLLGDLGANRFMFMPDSAITIEYSRDGGSTWTDYGTTEANKRSIFGTGTYYYYIGKADTTNKATANTNQYQLRVTLNTEGQLYTALNKFAFEVSTNGSNSCTVTIEGAFKSTPTTFTNITTNVGLAGWSGWNIVNIPQITTYGNPSNASSQYSVLRFIFKANGGNTNYVGLRVMRICGFGGVGWTIPSNMAKTGHLYSYDNYQSAFFPNTIRANNILTLYREGTTTNNYAAGINFINKDTTTGIEDASARIYVYNAHATAANGTNMVIQSGGGMFIGSGEAPASHYATVGTSYQGESTYITADANIYIQSNANTIGNRLGFYLSDAGNLVPCKADTATTNAISIGTADYKINNIYATNLNGVVIGTSPVFTDTKVTQTAITGDAWRKILGSTNYGSSATASITSGTTGTLVYDVDGPAFNTSSGMIYAKNYVMELATSHALYTAINNLGWTSEVID